VASTGPWSLSGHIETNILSFLFTLFFKLDILNKLTSVVENTTLDINFVASIQLHDFWQLVPESHRW